MGWVGVFLLVKLNGWLFLCWVGMGWEFVEFWLWLKSSFRLGWFGGIWVGVVCVFV